MKTLQHHVCDKCLTFTLPLGALPIAGMQINTPDGIEWRVTGVYQTRRAEDGIHQEWRLHADCLGGFIPDAWASEALAALHENLTAHPPLMRTSIYMRTGLPYPGTFTAQEDQSP